MSRKPNKVDVVEEPRSPSPLLFAGSSLADAYGLKKGQVTTFGEESHGLIPVADHRNRYGYIDTNNVPVIPCIYRDAGVVGDGGLAAVINEQGECGYIDTHGDVVIPFRWKPAKENFHARFIEGRAVVCDGDRFGIIDTAGNCVTPCRWSEISPYSEGIALVRDSDGSYGYMDREGRLISPCCWSRARDFSEGLGVVCKNDGFGAIDCEGRVVIPFDERRMFMESFSEGLAEVGIRFTGEFVRIGRTSLCSDWKIGYVDKRGEQVIPPRYASATSFYGGLAGVQSFDGKWGIIDKQGETVVPFRWKTLTYYPRHDRFRCCVTNFRRKSFDFEYVCDAAGNLVENRIEISFRKEGSHTYIDEKTVGQRIVRKA